jgi:hypothetical protein
MSFVTNKFGAVTNYTGGAYIIELPMFTYVCKPTDEQDKINIENCPGDNGSYIEYGVPDTVCDDYVGEADW